MLFTRTGSQGRVVGFLDRLPSTRKNALDHFVRKLRMQFLIIGIEEVWCVIILTSGQL